MVGAGKPGVVGLLSPAPELLAESLEDCIIAFHFGKVPERERIFDEMVELVFGAMLVALVVVDPICLLMVCRFIHNLLPCARTVNIFKDAKTQVTGEVVDQAIVSFHDGPHRVVAVERVVIVTRKGSPRIRGLSPSLLDP